MEPAIPLSRVSCASTSVFSFALNFSMNSTCQTRQRKRAREEEEEEAEEGGDDDDDDDVEQKEGKQEQRRGGELQGAVAMQGMGIQGLRR